MTRRAALLAGPFLLLVFPEMLLAWGPEGHIIVAKVADYRLSTKAKKEIAELLDGTDIFDDAICNWADHIRPFQKESAPWHFADIPKDADSFSENRDGDKGNNVIDQIKHWSDSLKELTKNKTAENKADRQKALKFVVHFVGDLHQPLHCADNKDRGGNDVGVYFLQSRKKTNLHKVWDSSILEESMGDLDALGYAKKLSRRITTAYKKEAKLWVEGDVEQWANESHELAKEYAYGLPSGKTPRLEQDYVDDGQRIVDLQLEKGGVRLAKILNDIFE